VHDQLRRGSPVAGRPSAHCPCGSSVAVNSARPADTREIELASELLDVTSEGELQGYLHRLVTELASAEGVGLPAGRARALVDGLTRTAVQTLPTLSFALGSGGQSAVGAGRSAAATAARVYGLELEGLSSEDRDYEIARQFVRLAQAATNPLAQAAPESRSGPEPRSGQWVRRGNTIVLIGAQPSRSESHTS
jgi:hypothetical protein